MSGQLEKKERLLDVLEIRNAVSRAVDNSLIDCEVFFRGRGWTKFSAAGNDLEPHAQEIWTLLQGNEIAPYVPPIPAVPSTVTFRQFLLALLDTGIFSEAEAETASERRVPGQLAAAFNSLGPSGAARARITWRTASTVDRAGLIATAFVTAGITSQEQIDQLLVLALSK